MPPVPQRARLRSLVLRGLSRMALLLVGTLVGLLLAELGFRLYALGLKPPTPLDPPSGTTRILCLGDSFVYGLGSEDRRGFPEHLQELLDSRSGPGGAEVLNRGVPGYNSSQAANSLDDLLRALRPQALILLVGHNNSWNFNDLHLDGLQGGVGLHIARGLGGLRLVKLFQLARGWETPSLAQTRSGGPERGRPEVERWMQLQNKQLKKQKLEHERESLQSALARDPADVFAMVGLAQVAEAEGDRAAQQDWMRRARATDPKAADQALAGLLRVSGWHEENRKKGGDTYLDRDSAALEGLYRALGSPKEPGADTLSRQQELLDEVLRRDLLWMVGRAGEEGVRVVLSSYPNDKPANRVLRSVSQELGLELVDQEPDFTGAIQSGDSPGRWFVLDGHCTSAGYRRMAENLAGVLQQL